MSYEILKLTAENDTPFENHSSFDVFTSITNSASELLTFDTLPALSPTSERYSGDLIKFKTSRGINQVENAKNVALYAYVTRVRC